MDQKVGISSDWGSEMSVKREVKAIMRKVIWIFIFYANIFGLG